MIKKILAFIICISASMLFFPGIRLSPSAMCYPELYPKDDTAVDTEMAAVPQRPSSDWRLTDEEAIAQQSIPQEGMYTLMLDSVLGPFTYYNQTDARWKDYHYGASSDTLAHYGCGPTAMAMIVSSLTPTTMIPPQISDWAVENKYWSAGSGSYHGLIPDCAQAYGLTVEPLADYSVEGILNQIRSGHILVALMKRGHFTANGHFIILIQATDDGNVRIADPFKYENTQIDWDPQIILNELNTNARNGGPIWSISVPDTSAQ